MRPILILCCCLFSTLIIAQKTDKKLQQQITQLIKNFKGDIGIYIHDLKRNKIVSISADAVFPLLVL